MTERTRTRIIERSTRIVLFICAVCVLSSTVRALDIPLPPGWIEAKRGDNLVIFYKEDEKVHARDVLAYTEVDAPPEKVFRIVTDFESWPRFMPYSKVSKILARPGPNEMILYQLVSPPFVSDRDYYLHVKLTRGTPANGGVFKSEWTCLPDYGARKDGVVRMRVNQGSWTYEPIDGGQRTRLVYSLLSLPGGWIPEWIINRSNLTLISHIFDAVRRRAKGK